MLSSEHGKPKRSTERLPKIGRAPLPRRQAAAAESSSGRSGPAGRGASAVGGPRGPPACRGRTKGAEESRTRRAQAAPEDSRSAAHRACSEARATSARVWNRFVDLGACGAPDRGRMRCSLPSVAGVADSAAAGMELPASGGTRSGAERGEDLALEKEALPGDKKKAKKEDRTSVF